VTDGPCGASLALEALDDRRAVRMRRVEDLDCDDAPDRDVLGFEDAAHPAFAEQPEYAVLGANDASDIQRVRSRHRRA